MERNERNRIIALIVAVGLVCILLVVLTAAAAELRHENNRLITENEALQSEVDGLSVKIKSSNSIEHIESVAVNQLGMVYPTAEQCVYVTSDDKPDDHFASVIRKEANAVE